jgi:uncharacterized membrane protein
MDIKVLVPIVIIFLHDVFTVIWIGGLSFMILVMVPALKKSGQDSQLLPKVTRIVMARFKWFVITSVIVLMVTGMLLSKRNMHSTGFMSFGSPYNIMLSIKHIFMLLMLLNIILKNILKKKAAPESKQEGPPEGRQPVGTRPAPGMFRFTLINFIFGVLILFLSAGTAAISSLPAV